MERSFLIGIILGVIILLISIPIAGGSILMFYDLPSIMITCGGCVCSLMVGYSFSDMAKAPKLVKIVLFPPKIDLKELIITFVSFAEKARREGLLALEDDLEELDDPLMKKGLQLVVDGTDPELVRTILEIEVDEMASRHDAYKRFFDDAATYAPAFGMIGTLMGLVMMLVNLSDRSSVGPYLAVAIITTFYGAVLCYLIFTPIATRLDMMTGTEVTVKSIIIRGVLSIQAGDNPRIMRDKLIAYMSPSDREKIKEEIPD